METMIFYLFWTVFARVGNPFNLVYEGVCSCLFNVAIMFRDVSGVDAGVDGQRDNPFEFEEVKKRIIEGLSIHGYEYEKEYIILKVPNITTKAETHVHQ